MKKYQLVSAVVSAGIGVFASVIDFSVNSLGLANPAYTEGGMSVFTVDNGNRHVIFPSSSDHYMWGVADTNEGWLAFAAGVEFELALEETGTFDLYTMDIAPSTVGSGTVDFTVIGYTDSGSVTNNYTGLTTVQSITLNWSGLNSVTFFSSGSDAGVDKISTSAIPEPSTLAMLGFASGAIFLVRRCLREKGMLGGSR